MRLMVTAPKAGRIMVKKPGMTKPIKKTTPPLVEKKWMAKPELAERLNRNGIRLIVRNRSEFEHLELRVHNTPNYMNVPNMFQNPLLDEAEIEVPFKNNQYITVIRRRVEGGTRIAFTTGQGLNVSTNGYTLLVFQQSFRLLRPEDISEGN